MKTPILYVAIVVISNGVKAQNVGIGTASPTAGLHIVNNNGIISTGVIDEGNVISITGAGAKMIWYPRMAAFRVGLLDNVGASFWDDVNLGRNSIGMGWNAKAQGASSIAIGQAAVAINQNDAAIGYYANATGTNSIALATAGAYAKAQFSVAIGNDAYANAYGSVAIGRSLNAGYDASWGTNTYAIGTGESLGFNAVGSHFATGLRSFVIGNNCKAVSNYSMAVGNNCSVGEDFYFPTTATNAFALGNFSQASGKNSFAFGNYANTNLKRSAWVISSRDDGALVSSESNYQMTMDFAGGYRFWSGSGGQGVNIPANGNAWVSNSDVRKKENIMPLNDSIVLDKLSGFSYSSWNYKNCDSQNDRHYGIMAQDFYLAFGHDEIGSIGNDTTVNPIDMMGIAYSAIKALKHENDKIKTENNELREMLQAIRDDINGMKVNQGKKSNNRK